MDMKTEDREVMIRMTGVGKQYRLGEIGGGTLQADLKEWLRARKKGGAKTENAGRARGSFYALRGIDLTVRKGEALGIIGRNGAGKSTLLKLLSRITGPTEGDIDLYGRVASMLEVGTGFHGEMTGRENIYLNGAILGMSRREIDAKMDDIIDFSEVRDFIDTPVKRYSSGMYVKLGFAVAAHLDSEIIIMDEVLAVGDMAFQHKCLDRMRSAAVTEQRTVLYVSHNMSTIKRLCDRCIVLDAGKLIFDGAVDDAISLYTGGSGQLQRTVVFGPEHRPYDEYLRVNRRFNIDRLEVLGRELPDYGSGEKARLRIVCSASMPFPEVGFRFELWAPDGTKAGSMLSANFAGIREGANAVTLELTTDGLAPGEYRADLVAFQHDGDGNEDILDGVYPGLAFNVRSGHGARDYLDWHPRYWGYVRLGDLEITDCVPAREEERT